MDTKLQEFVIHQLTPHIGSMIDSLPKLESEPLKASKDLLEKLAIDFNTNWKSSIEKIHTELTKSFPNFQNGARVLHATLTALVIYYKRFLSVWDTCLKGQKTKLVPIGIQPLLVEIKRFKSTFS